MKRFTGDAPTLYTSLYHQTVNDEEIHYDDYTSLYRWVNKYGKYPIRHPTILHDPNTTDLGLAKCTVLPPTALYHPVLPYCHDSKLTFPLCHTWVHDNLTTTCQHTDDESALTGTWCTPELEEAIPHGYTILNVHEIWHFPASHTGLFADNVNTWLKLKEEASGWPRTCTTNEQRTAHIAAYQTREGIALNPAKMEKNDGQWPLAKLMLNSLWGKFGQRTDKIQVTNSHEFEFTNPQSLLEFMDSNQHHVNYVSVLTEDRVEIHYCQVADDGLPSINLNIFIAHHAHRRHEALHHLQERVLYFNTYSVTSSTSRQLLGRLKK